MASAQGFDFKIVEAVLEANQETQERMVAKVRDALGGLEGRTVAQLGLSFKPETDDIRESPALFVLDGLLAGGAQVRAFDPAAMDGCRADYPQVEFCADAYEAADGAEALVICTEWNEFRALGLKRLRRHMKRPLIVDLRNIYEPQRVAAAGFRYVSVGRPEAGQGEEESA
jgi:UDPglucose 6-dehydrogenase